MNDTKRTKRLQNLIDQLKADQDVANRDLKNALTPDEWKAYESSVEQERTFKATLADRPTQLDKYVAQLKRADLLYNRAEGMRSKSKTKTRTILTRQFESAYEKALEYLAEAINIRPDVVMWLDRQFNQQPENACGRDPMSVPRLITSASLNRQRSCGSMTGNRRSLKLSALQSSLENIHSGKVGSKR